MNDDQLRSALQAEYLHLQKAVEDMDGRAVTIKAWSISFSLAAVGGAFASKASNVLLLACASAVLFWWLEARWKTFQDAYYTDRRHRAALSRRAGAGVGAADSRRLVQELERRQSKAPMGDPDLAACRAASCSSLPRG